MNESHSHSLDEDSRYPGHERRRVLERRDTDPLSLQSDHQGMDINNHIDHINRTDVSASMSSSLLSHSGEFPSGFSTPPEQHNKMEHDLHSQLLNMQHQHRMQQKVLLQQFQEQQAMLREEQECQVHEHLKVQASIQEVLLLKKQAEYEAKREQLEEQQRQERERKELERIELLKHKKTEDQSAIASMEVKAKLHEFVLNKKQREAQGGSVSGSPPQFRQWTTTQHSSLEGHSPPQGLSPPYKHRLLGNQYDADFPLRKTVSDSNLKYSRPRLKQKVSHRTFFQPQATCSSEPNLKVRLALKQKMLLDRRSSPLLRRRDRLAASKRAPLSLDTPEMCHSNPDSGPNTPPSTVLDPHVINSKELISKMVVNQSMPNISTIGPARESPTGSDNSIPGGPIGGAPGGGSPLADLEAIRTRGGTATAYPISTQPQPTIPPHILANPSAFYQMRMMEGTDFIPASLPPGTTLPSGPLPGAPPTVPGGAPGTVFIPRQFNHLDEGSPPVMPPGVLNMPPYGTAPLPAEGPPIHPRIRRPLNRTHSAPLPLGPHLMAGQLMPHPQQPQADQIRNQKMFIKQRIQNTVLQRAGSKNQMENVDEEAEVKLRESYEAFSSHPDVKPDLDAQVKGRAAFLQHQREMYHLNKHPLQHPGVVPTAGMLARPLARAQSSPAVTLPAGLNPSSPDINQSHLTTGIAYDPVMLKHECVCRNSTNHPENPERLESIWTRLLETGLAHRCMKIKCRKAALEELQLCHEEAYTLLYGTSSADRQKLAPNVYEACPPQFVSLPCGGVGVDSDTVWNEEYTSQATRTAVGSVIEMAQKVCKGHLRNGLCIVRPPGHHAEHNQPMGFCYFNAIAVAARVLQEQHEMKRILIIDWDVHHGNSTQQIFYSSPNVLYISLHRHDNGNFFPGTGSPDECGVEQGLGYNVNVSFAGSLNPPMSDAEYLSAFRNIVMPISRRFNPEIVLVSSGFDAADGHSAPLGGYKVSPTCFGHMTRQLMTLANGRVVLVLEGGYDLSSICDASEICVQALIDEEIPPIVEDELHRPPCGFAVEAMQNTIKHQLQYWPVLQQTEKYLGLSLFESESKSRKTLSRDESETVNAFASLSVVPEDSPDLPSSTEPMES